MRYSHHDPHTGSLFRLHVGEPSLGRDVFAERAEQPSTIVWNRSPHPQSFRLDDRRLALAPAEVVTLMSSQAFTFEPADDLVAWQFNREFYCIVDHDQEVSCAGLLWFGTQGLAKLQLDGAQAESLELLLQVFEEEFRERDNLQAEMLRVLLKRLIVKLTRLYKVQYVDEALSAPDLDLIRQFGLLVELHFRENHQVQDYAAMMHKSPKTLANVFRGHSERTPQQIIRDRIALEAKRMLIYTDRNVAEIGYAVGFKEPAHFSRFFSKAVGESPGAFRKGVREGLAA